MTLPAFNPPRAPTLPARKTTNFRIKQADLGDGSVQRGQDGINAATVEYELSWNDLALSDADTLEGFLVARGGWQAFTFTVPGDIARKYRSGPVTRAYERDGQRATVSATFTEVHDL